jgi:hypothetical protein
MQSLWIPVRPYIRKKICTVSETLCNVVCESGSPHDYVHAVFLRKALQIFFLYYLALFYGRV